MFSSKSAFEGDFVAAQDPAEAEGMRCISMIPALPAMDWVMPSIRAVRLASREDVHPRIGSRFEFAFVHYAFDDAEKFGDVLNLVDYDGGGAQLKKHL